MNKKRLAFGAAIIVLLAVGFFIYFYWQRNAFKTPFNPTPRGVFFEDILPADASIVVGFNPSDAEELGRFNKLWDAVVQDKKDAIIPFLAGTVVRGNDKSFTAGDMKKAFGDAVSFVVTWGTTPPPDEDETKTLYMSRNIEVFVKAEDVELAKAIIDKGFPGGEVGSFKDVVFVTNSKTDGVKKIMERAEGKAKALSSNKIFCQTVERLQKPFIGYMFLNASEVKLNDDSLAVEVATFNARQDGLLMNTIVVGDEEKLKKSSLASLLTPSTAYLYKKIPAQDLIGFAEVNNIGGLFLEQFESLQGKEKSTKNSVLEDFKNSTGFDFKTDILPFTNKGFVAAIYNAGTVIPGLALYFDSSAAPQKAREVIQKIKTLLNGAVPFAGTLFETPKDKPVIELTEFATIKDGGVIKIYLDRIPAKMAKIPLFQKLTAPVEVSYGVTDDNITFLAVVPHFEKYLAIRQPMDNFPLLKDALSLETEPGNIVVFDGKAVADYVAKIVQFARDQKSFSTSNEEAYNLLTKYLAPIEGFVQVGKADGSNIDGKALLKIAQ